jgi:acyl-coenzyme A thioesterase PaaI-like protein
MGVSWQNPVMTDAATPEAAASTPGSAAAPPAARRSTGSGAAERIRGLWDRLSEKPGGKRLFSWLIGRTAPYTATIGGRVQELGTGHAVVTLRDRRKVRNHLKSIHANAQINQAELVSGLAVMYSMPDGLRGIPVHLEIDYEKKARGTITATCDLPGPIPAPAQGERLAFEAPVVLTDPEGDVVSRALARWVINS